MKRDLAFPMHIPNEDQVFGFRDALAVVRRRPLRRVLRDAAVGIWLIGCAIAGIVLLFAVGSVRQ